MTEHAPQPPSRPRPNQWLLSGILFAPGVATLLIGMGEPSHSRAAFQAAFSVGLPLSILAGLVCAGMSVTSRENQGGHRLFREIARFVGYTFLSFFLCTLGCTAAVVR